MYRDAHTAWSAGGRLFLLCGSPRRPRRGRGWHRSEGRFDSMPSASPSFLYGLAVGCCNSVQRLCRMCAAGKPRLNVLRFEEYLATRHKLDVCQPPRCTGLINHAESARNLFGQLLPSDQISHRQAPPPIPSRQCPARGQCGQLFSDLRHGQKSHY